MASLPVISGSETVKVFERFGWTVPRQTSSHIIMTKEGENCFVVSSESQRSGTGNVEKSYQVSQPYSG
jgi:predicted RNA binding protein YcfA (HicA-like mRNA interferase family)